MKLHWLLPSFIGVVLLPSTAKADSLTSWHFDANQNRLDLTTDEGVQPNVKLIANPTRLVIDLPGVILGHPQTHQRVNPVIPDIRVGQFDPQTTRMVVELSSGYTLDPTKVQVQGSPTHWSVQLPTPQRLVGDAALASLNQPIGQEVEIPSTVIPSAPVSELGSASTFAGVMPLATEMAGLRPQVQALMARYKSLSSGMFFLDLDTGNYLDIHGERVFPAASTIKLPILVAFFQDLDAGRVSLDETLVMRPDLMTGGSGVMQDDPAGTRFTALETVNKMITISDNTATNMIIDRLGGIAKLNRRFRSWGLQDTVMHHMLADLRGTNTTSSKDMVRLLALLADEKLLSPSSHEQVLDILRHTTIKTLLPAGLGPGATIANKTGDIGFLIGDAGIISMPNGKRYLAGIFVRRPYDDPKGRDFIRQVSRLVYSYLDQPTSVSSAPPRRTTQVEHGIPEMFQQPHS